MSGSTFPIGTTFVQCSATNSRGFTRFGTFFVAVRGSALLTLSLPPFISVPSAGAGGTVVTWTATAHSAIDGDVPVTCTPPSGSTFFDGTTPVTCTASDSTGNTATGSFNVTVGDTTPPNVLVPDDITVEATMPSGAVVTFTAAANDNADGPLTPVCSPASGSTFALGTTTVTCSATDSRGNTGTATFHVTVQDTTPPTLTLPANITAEATSGSGAAVTFTATATDLVDGNVAVTCTPPSGSTFPFGTTTVNCSATDAHGNIAAGSFTVTVQDTTPPTLNLPSPITVSADAACTAAVTYTATATDLVDVTDPVVCTPASGSTFALGTTTVNCSSTDAHGNTALGSFTVTVNDTTPPTIQSVTATPSNLWPDNHKMVDVTVAVTAVDNCDTAPVNRIISVTANQPITGPGSGNTTPDYIITGDLTLQLRAERTQGHDRTYTITVTSTDFSGNTSTATTTVTVSQTNNSHGRAAGH